MKKNLVGVILASILLFGPNIVEAESSCSYSELAELNDIAANVKTTYEPVSIKTGTAIDVDNSTIDNIVYVDAYVKGFYINVLNVTEDIYVKISNDKDNGVLTFKNADTDGGLAKFQTTKSNEIVTYTIEVYANKYDCTGELIRKYTMITPMYNTYSELQVCSENSDFYYCQEFISTENISLDAFYKNLEKYETKVEEEKQEKEKSLWDKIKEFYHDNMIAINVAGTIIVIAGVTTTAILIKKRRSRVL